MKNPRVILLSVMLIILAFLAGSYGISIKKQLQEKSVLEKEKTELEMELIKYKYYQDEESKLDDCLAEADDSSRHTWMKNCKNFGSNIEKDDDGEITTCSLPGYLSTKISDQQQVDKDNCFRRYSK